MDQADRAQARELELRDEALYCARHRPAETALVAENGRRLCLDCEDPLSEKRLKANPQAVRCTDCQQEHEHQQMRARGRP